VTEPVSVLHGDCIDLMRGMPAESVDAIVTDPPYGLGFMGKAWDALPPGEEWALECLRVLKPGGHLLAFGGTRTWHRLAVAVEDAGFEIRDSIAWMHGEGFPKGKAQLKPSHEPIVMARRRTVAPRSGLLQIEAARIEGIPQPGGASAISIYGTPTGYKPSGLPNVLGNPNGRWPANVILDEAMAAELDAQSGYLHPAGNKADTATGIGATYGATSYQVSYAGIANRTHKDQGGGASRFFYVAKASKRERPTVNGVSHTTVKPLKLMRHLVRLVTPEGGTILDPFAGSGTTIEAAILEGFNVIGIEREAEYLPLIQARIDRAA